MISGGVAAQQASKGAKEGAKQAAANSMMGMTLQVRIILIGCIGYMYIHYFLDWAAA